MSTTRPVPSWPRALPRAEADRLVLVLSDLEMGAGGPTDDLPNEEFVGELLLGYNGGPTADLPVELVFNGDTFDFLKTTYQGAWPRHVTAEVALGKLERIARAHPRFFQALREFLAHGRAERRVVFVVGNHDPELVFPEVQQAIRRLCDADDAQVRFPGLSYDIGELHVEHGSQRDACFAVDPDEPFIHHEGRTLLNLAWGSVALLEVAMPLQPLLYHLDRVKPRRIVFELIPQARDFIMGAYWRYWTRDFLRDWIGGGDPVKRFNWTMFREIAWRFGSGEADVVMGDAYQRALVESDTHRCYVIGHQHEPLLWRSGGRTLLRTGCFRHEWLVEDGGRKQTLLPKVYAEVFMRGGQVRRGQIVEFDGPPPPKSHVPDFLSLAPVVDRLLRGAEDTRAAQASQEAKEAANGVQPLRLPFRRALRG